MKFTIYNVDPEIHQFDEKMRAVLADVNANIIEKQCFSENDVIDFASDADGIIAARVPITGNVIKELTKCKIIARPGTGTDNVDHKAATEKGIPVVYVPDFCAEEVANHALMFILACNKKLLNLDKFVKSGNWGFDLVQPLSAVRGQILGLVGFGRIAQDLAKKAQVFGLDVWAYDPYIRQDVYESLNVKKCNIEEIIKGSDYISLHTPLTNETEKMINEGVLNAMKPTAYLINCARGGVVDEKALIIALKEKKIAGAALDCLELEPPDKSNELFSLDNVLFTPHSAAYSNESIDYLRHKTCLQIAQVLNGQKPEFIRNPEVLEKIKLS